MKSAKEFAEKHQYDLEQYDEGGYVGINENAFAKLLDEYADQRSNSKMFDSIRAETLFAFIAEVKKKFADQNWDYFDFIAERVLKVDSEAQRGDGGDLPMKKEQNADTPPDAKPVLSDVTPEMKNFAQEYSLWVITYGQVYINALSPKFEVDNEPMEIFLSKYYGKNWVNGLVK